MAPILVVFESTYGQASKIAEHIGEVLRRTGHAARVLHVDAARAMDLDAFDGFFVVAPVYGGHHPRSIVSFVRSFANRLSTHASAFVSVCNAAASADPAIRANAMRVARTMLAETSWKPDLVLTVGGSLAYPRYGWLLRMIMKHIAGKEGAPTDTSRTHELTDWAALDGALEHGLATFDAHAAAHAA